MDVTYEFILSNTCIKSGGITPIDTCKTINKIYRRSEAIWKILQLGDHCFGRMPWENRARLLVNLSTLPILD